MSRHHCDSTRSLFLARQSETRRDWRSAIYRWVRRAMCRCASARSRPSSNGEPSVEPLACLGTLRAVIRAVTFSLSLSLSARFRRFDDAKTDRRGGERNHRRAVAVRVISKSVSRRSKNQRQFPAKWFFLRIYIYIYIHREDCARVYSRSPLGGNLPCADPNQVKKALSPDLPFVLCAMVKSKCALRPRKYICLS